MEDLSEDGLKKEGSCLEIVTLIEPVKKQEAESEESEKSENFIAFL